MLSSNIQQIANCVAEHFQPEKIILFGSHARGEANSNSDIDLLIVMDSTAPRGQRGAPIIKLLAENFAEPVDVVVRSAQSLEEWESVPGSFAHQVLKEGVVLYERQKQLT